MRLNDRVDWRSVFGDFIRRGSLADPANRKRSAFVLTLLFLEAGVRELDDQIVGRSRVRKEGLAWARITRQIIVRRAARLREELAPELRRGIRVGEGGFRDRWPGLGGMSNFFMCMVRYACNDPRWSRVLDRAPQSTLAALPRLRAGELTLAELIEKVAKRSLTMSVRLARCWLFPLLLTMDSTWRKVGNAAYRTQLANYALRWVPVYEQTMTTLGVALRPDMNPARLSTEVASQIHGAAMDIAGKGEADPGDVDRFVHAVQALVYASIDPGDGKDMATALAERVELARAAS